MTVFFSGDTHFGHRGIITACSRPFSSVEEMDEAMLVQWNAVVAKSDTVWHLGDFCHRAAPARAQALFHRLNGTKHLVIGNHDDAFVRSLGWASQHQIVEFSAEGARLCLCHYPMRDWPGRYRGAIHLHGHSHGRAPAMTSSCDVGVDCWSFYPATLDQIKIRLAAHEAADEAVAAPIPAR